MVDISPWPFSVGTCGGLGATCVTADVPGTQGTCCNGAVCGGSSMVLTSNNMKMGQCVLPSLTSVSIPLPVPYPLW